MSYTSGKPEIVWQCMLQAQPFALVPFWYSLGAIRYFGSVGN